MIAKGPTRLPPGRQPYDTLIGFKVGALTGGVLGAVAAAATGSAWYLLGGALVGGGIGYGWERRRQRSIDADRDT